MALLQRCLETRYGYGNYKTENSNKTLRKRNITVSFKNIEESVPICFTEQKKNEENL